MMNRSDHAAMTSPVRGQGPGGCPLRLRPQPAPGYARLEDPGFIVWGASPVRPPDGRYHLFYSRWPEATGFESWVTHSEIAHAEADEPLGPYRFRDVALPARGGAFWDGHVTHNPTVHFFDGSYYLYYMGNRGDREIFRGRGQLNWVHRNLQRIGVAMAEHPAGPWLRADVPVLDVHDDELCVSNPGVTRRPDGRFLMVYKAVKKDRPLPFGGPVVHRMAVADRPEGPFIRQKGDIFTAEGFDFPAEDPYIWFDPNRGCFFVIVKDMTGSYTGSGPALVLFESLDGSDWKPSANPLVTGTTIAWEGYTQTLERLERPQLLFEAGRASVLFAAAMDLSGKTLNVHIPVSEASL